MVGFKLADGITSAPNRFGYYMFFEDAESTMKELFDNDDINVLDPVCGAHFYESENGRALGNPETFYPYAGYR